MAIRNLTILRYLGLMIEVMLWKWYLVLSIQLLLMAEILQHLGCIKPYKQWEKLPTSTGAGFQPSTVSGYPPRRLPGPIFASRSNSCRRKVSKSVWPERLVLRSPRSAGNDKNPRELNMIHQNQTKW